MQINYPTVKTDKNNRVYINFYIENNRYRLYNGNRIGVTLNPNKFPKEKRTAIANLLAAQIYDYINKGGVLKSYRANESFKPTTDKQFLNSALRAKLLSDCTERYTKYLVTIHKKITSPLNDNQLSSKELIKFLSNYKGTSYNTVRRHLNVLINEAINQGMNHNPMKGVKTIKTKAKLHKPINDVPSILEEIKRFNYNLYLCCLITYGCLLRPHREVRELCWGDFSGDLSYINLSGHRNKSGKNRIVPVPSYVKEVLIKRHNHLNIFSGEVNALNTDYFKTLWGRFKKSSKLLEGGQTLYSFRHTGAIEIFKRTGSVTKLQKAMGHSSINVSLTYLRGLEVSELKEEDMPTLFLK